MARGQRIWEGRRRHAATALAFLTVVFFYGVNLHTPALWADEAENAAMSRNVLRSGLPVGWDGRNLLTFDDCLQLGEGLVTRRAGWLQYYVGAASQLLFPDPTLRARALFAALGALTFVPLLVLLRARTRQALPLATLLMLSPQVILFQRNGRYYPLAILLSTSLLAVLYTPGLSRALRRSGAVACAILLFHTHPLLAAGGLSAVVLASLRCDPQTRWIAALAAAAGLASWLALYAAIPALDLGPRSLGELAFTDFGRWWAGFGRGARAMLLDLDFVGALPLVAWVGLLAWCARRRPGAPGRLSRDPVVVAIVASLALQGLLTAALVGAETPARYGVLRYVPHLTLLLGVPLYLLLAAVFGDGRRALAAFALVSALNTFSLSALLGPGPFREGRPSWWPSVYAEILRPPVDPVPRMLAAVVRDLDESEQIVDVYPRFMADSFTYYLGRRLLVAPTLRPGSACEAEVVRTIGESGYARLRRAPERIVAFAPGLLDAPEGYRRELALALHRRTPDATRPELNRHGFHDPGSEGAHVAVYRRVE